MTQKLIFAEREGVWRLVALLPSIRCRTKESSAAPVWPQRIDPKVAKRGRPKPGYKSLRGFLSDQCVSHCATTGLPVRVNLEGH